MAVDIGLGTALRALLAALDDDVEALYAARDEPFRPRFYPVWQFLDRHGEAGVGELAGWAGVSQPAMTQTLAAMVSAGLAFAREGQDRRRRIYALTESGRSTGDNLAPLFEATHAAAQALEREAGTDIVGQATHLLARLDKRRFRDRIEDELETTR